MTDALHKRGRAEENQWAHGINAKQIDELAEMARAGDAEGLKRVGFAADSVAALIANVSARKKTEEESD